MNLSAPWYLFYNKLQELFKNDPEIHMEFKDEKDINLYVDNQDKAKALEVLLPTTKSFGNVDININVIPANFETCDDLQLFEKAFKGNPIFIKTEKISLPDGDEIKAVVFKKEVAQYYSDDISQNRGYTSTLYQHLANEIFEDTDVSFWTDVEECINVNFWTDVEE